MSKEIETGKQELNPLEEIKELKKEISILKNEKSNLIQSKEDLTLSREFLSVAALEFEELPMESDIYDFIGEKLNKLVGNDFVVISKFDPESDSFKIKSLAGKGKLTSNIAKRFMGTDLFGLSVPMSSVSKEEMHAISTGQWYKSKEGLYELSGKQFPKKACRAIEKMLDISEINILGFKWKDKIYGSGSIILTKNKKLENVKTIQAFINLASVALQRREAEKELQENEEKVRTILESSPDSITVTDMNMKILDCNQATVDMYQAPSKEDLIGLNASELVDPNDLLKLAEVVENTLQKMERVSFELNLYKRDGTIFPAEISGNIITDSTGAPVAFLAITKDITKRKKAEELLKNSEEKFRSIFESAKDGIIMMNSDAKITSWNSGAETLFGYSTDETLNQSITMIMPPRFHDSFKKGIKTAIAGDKSIFMKRHEYPALRKDGNEFSAEMSLNQFKVGEETFYTAIVRDVTPRKKAEMALKENEEKFRGIFNNANDMITLNDMKEDGLPGKFLEVNDVTSERLGYTRDEMLNMGPRDIVAPEKLSEMPGNAAVLSEKGHNIFEILHLTKEGKRIPVEVNNHLINYNGRKISLAISRDITERQKAEEDLKNSEERFKILFENAPDLYFYSDLKGNIIDCNKATEKLTGYKKEELVGKNFTELNLISPSQIPKLVAKTAEFALGRKPEPTELVFNRKDREKITVEIHAYMVTMQGQKLFLGTARDITTRKKAELALKESEEKYRNLADLLPQMVIELNQKGEITFANRAVSELIGYSKKDLDTGFKPQKIVIHEDQKRVKENIMKTMMGEKLGGNEYTALRKDGTKFPIVVYCSRITRNNKPAGIRAIILDYTELKEAQEEIQKSLEEKEMLLKEIHHRVKNNLLIISSLLNIQSRYIKDKESLDIFKESQNRARSMALIHERLYQSTDLKRINFGEYIRTLSTELFHAYEADPGSVLLKINVEDIFLDVNTAVPLGLIVNELITNSIQHAFPKGMKGEICIDFHPKDEQYEFIVKDDGKGFLNNVDFRNTDSLGLQIVNSLTDQIDGEIEFDGEKGTEFKIIFEEKVY